MRSGRMPWASAWSVNDTVGSSRRTCYSHPDAENTVVYRLSDGRLDGKSTREYQVHLSRGDLSRPACSHVKQVAKQAGDSVIPACGIFPGRFFVTIFFDGHDGGHMPDSATSASS